MGRRVLSFHTLLNSGIYKQEDEFMVDISNSASKQSRCRLNLLIC